MLIFALATVCGGAGSSDAALKKLVSIAVTPANPSIALGQTEQFTATGLIRTAARRTSRHR